MKRYGAWIAFLLLLAVIVGQSVAIATEKEAKIQRTAVFDTIRKGYEAQFIIRGNELSMDAMYETLSPYFTDHFLQVFTDENSDGKGAGGHLLSEAAPFSFTSNTKIVHDQEHGILYVYERIETTYEVVSLQQVGKTWKLAGYHSGSTLLVEIKELEKAGKEVQ